MSDLLGILLPAIYFLTVIPLAVTFVQQIRLISGDYQNGLEYYRKALAIIVFGQLLDAVYFTVAEGFHQFGDPSTYSLLARGYPVLGVKVLLGIGAWLYYFIYRQNDLRFLTFRFWAELFKDTFHGNK